MQNKRVNTVNTEGPPSLQLVPELVNKRLFDNGTNNPNYLFAGSLYIPKDIVNLVSNGQIPEVTPAAAGNENQLNVKEKSLDTNDGLLLIDDPELRRYIERIIRYSKFDPIEATSIVREASYEVKNRARSLIRRVASNNSQKDLQAWHAMAENSEEESEGELALSHNGHSTHQQHNDDASMKRLPSKRSLFHKVMDGIKIKKKNSKKSKAAPGIRMESRSLAGPSDYENESALMLQEADIQIEKAKVPETNGLFMNGLSLNLEEEMLLCYLTKPIFEPKCHFIVMPLSQETFIEEEGIDAENRVERAQSTSGIEKEKASAFKRRSTFPGLSASFKKNPYSLRMSQYMRESIEPVKNSSGNIKQKNKKMDKNKGVSSIERESKEVTSKEIDTIKEVANTKESKKQTSIEYHPKEKTLNLSKTKETITNGVELKNKLTNTRNSKEPMSTGVELENKIVSSTRRKNKEPTSSGVEVKNKVSSIKGKKSKELTSSRVEDNNKATPTTKAKEPNIKQNEPKEKVVNGTRNKSAETLNKKIEQKKKGVNRIEMTSNLRGRSQIEPQNRTVSVTKMKRNEPESKGVELKKGFLNRTKTQSNELTNTEVIHSHEAVIKLMDSLPEKTCTIEIKGSRYKGKFNIRLDPIIDDAIYKCMINFKEACINQKRNYCGKRHSGLLQDFAQSIKDMLTCKCLLKNFFGPERPKPITPYKTKVKKLKPTHSKEILNSDSSIESVSPLTSTNDPSDAGLSLRTNASEPSISIKSPSLDSSQKSRKSKRNPFKFFSVDKKKGIKREEKNENGSSPPKTNTETIIQNHQIEINCCFESNSTIERLESRLDLNKHSHKFPFDIPYQLSDKNKNNENDYKSRRAPEISQDSLLTQVSSEESIINYANFLHTKFKQKNNRIPSCTKSTSNPKINLLKHSHPGISFNRDKQLGSRTPKTTTKICSEKSVFQRLDLKFMDSKRYLFKDENESCLNTLTQKEDETNSESSQSSSNIVSEMTFRSISRETFETRGNNESLHKYAKTNRGGEQSNKQPLILDKKPPWEPCAYDSSSKRNGISQRKDKANEQQKSLQSREFIKKSDGSGYIDEGNSDVSFSYGTSSCYRTFVEALQNLHCFFESKEEEQKSKTTAMIQKQTQTNCIENKSLERTNSETNNTFLSHHEFSTQTDFNTKDLSTEHVQKSVPQIHFTQNELFVIKEKLCLNNKNNGIQKPNERNVHGVSNAEVSNQNKNLKEIICREGSKYLALPKMYEQARDNRLPGDINLIQNDVLKSGHLKSQSDSYVRSCRQALGEMPKKINHPSTYWVKQANPNTLSITSHTFIPSHLNFLCSYENHTKLETPEEETIKYYTNQNVYPPKNECFLNNTFKIPLEKYEMCNTTDKLRLFLENPRKRKRGASAFGKEKNAIKKTNNDCYQNNNNSPAPSKTLLMEGSTTPNNIRHLFQSSYLNKCSEGKTNFYLHQEHIKNKECKNIQCCLDKLSGKQKIVPNQITDCPKNYHYNRAQITKKENKFNHSRISPEVNDQLNVSSHKNFHMPESGGIHHNELNYSNRLVKDTNMLYTDTHFSIGHTHQHNSCNHYASHYNVPREHTNSNFEENLSLSENESRKHFEGTNNKRFDMLPKNDNDQLQQSNCMLDGTVNQCKSLKQNQNDTDNELNTHEISTESIDEVSLKSTLICPGISSQSLSENIFIHLKEVPKKQLGTEDTDQTRIYKNSRLHNMKNSKNIQNEHSHPSLILHEFRESIKWADHSENDLFKTINISNKCREKSNESHKVFGSCNVAIQCNTINPFQPNKFCNHLSSPCHLSTEGSSSRDFQPKMFPSVTKETNIFSKINLDQENTRYCDCKNQNNNASQSSLFLESHLEDRHNYTFEQSECNVQETYVWPEHSQPIELNNLSKRKFSRPTGSISARNVNNFDNMGTVKEKRGIPIKNDRNIIPQLDSFQPDSRDSSLSECLPPGNCKFYCRSKDISNSGVVIDHYTASPIRNETNSSNFSGLHMTETLTTNSIESNDNIRQHFTPKGFNFPRCIFKRNCTNLTNYKTNFSNRINSRNSCSKTNTESQYETGSMKNIKALKDLYCIQPQSDKENSSKWSNSNYNDDHRSDGINLNIKSYIHNNDYFHNDSSCNKLNHQNNIFQRPLSQYECTCVKEGKHVQQTCSLPSFGNQNHSYNTITNKNKCLGDIKRKRKLSPVCDCEMRGLMQSKSSNNGGNVEFEERNYSYKCHKDITCTNVNAWKTCVLHQARKCSRKDDSSNKGERKTIFQQKYRSVFNNRQIRSTSPSSRSINRRCNFMCYNFGITPSWIGHFPFQLFSKNVNKGEKSFNFDIFYPLRNDFITVLMMAFPQVGKGMSDSEKSAEEDETNWERDFSEKKRERNTTSSHHINTGKKCKTCKKMRGKKVTFGKIHHHYDNSLESIGRKKHSKTQTPRREQQKKGSRKIDDNSLHYAMDNSSISLDKSMRSMHLEQNDNTSDTKLEARTVPSQYINYTKPLNTFLRADSLEEQVHIRHHSGLPQQEVAKQIYINEINNSYLSKTNNLRGENLVDSLSRFDVIPNIVASYISCKECERAEKGSYPRLQSLNCSRPETSSSLLLTNNNNTQPFPTHYNECQNNEKFYVQQSYFPLMNKVDYVVNSVNPLSESSLNFTPNHIIKRHYGPCYSNLSVPSDISHGINDSMKSLSPNDSYVEDYQHYSQGYAYQTPSHEADLRTSSDCILLDPITEFHKGFAVKPQRPITNESLVIQTDDKCNIFNNTPNHPKYHSTFQNKYFSTKKTNEKMISSTQTEEMYQFYNTRLAEGRNEHTPSLKMAFPSIQTTMVSVLENNDNQRKSKIENSDHQSMQNIINLTEQNENRNPSARLKALKSCICNDNKLLASKINQMRESLKGNREDSVKKSSTKSTEIDGSSKAPNAEDSILSTKEQELPTMSNRNSVLPSIRESILKSRMGTTNGVNERDPSLIAFEKLDSKPASDIHDKEDYQQGCICSNSVRKKSYPGVSRVICSNPSCPDLVKLVDTNVAKCDCHQIYPNQKKSTYKTIPKIVISSNSLLNEDNSKNIDSYNDKQKDRIGNNEDSFTDSSQEEELSKKRTPSSVNQTELIHEKSPSTLINPNLTQVSGDHPTSSKASQTEKEDQIDMRLTQKKTKSMNPSQEEKLSNRNTHSLGNDLNENRPKASKTSHTENNKNDRKQTKETNIDPSAEEELPNDSRLSSEYEPSVTSKVDVSPATSPKVSGNDRSTVSRASQTDNMNQRPTTKKGNTLSAENEPDLVNMDYLLPPLSTHPTRFSGKSRPSSKASQTENISQIDPSLPQNQISNTALSSEEQLPYKRSLSSENEPSLMSKTYLSPATSPKVSGIDRPSTASQTNNKSRIDERPTNKKETSFGPSLEKDLSDESSLSSENEPDLVSKGNLSQPTSLHHTRFSDKVRPSGSKASQTENGNQIDHRPSKKVEFSKESTDSSKNKPGLINKESPSPSTNPNLSQLLYDVLPTTPKASQTENIKEIDKIPTQHKETNIFPSQDKISSTIPKEKSIRHGTRENEPDLQDNLPHQEKLPIIKIICNNPECNSFHHPNDSRVLTCECGDCQIICNGRQMEEDAPKNSSNSKKIESQNKSKSTYSVEENKSNEQLTDQKLVKNENLKSNERSSKDQPAINFFTQSEIQLPVLKSNCMNYNSAQFKASQDDKKHRIDSQSSVKEEDQDLAENQNKIKLSSKYDLKEETPTISRECKGPNNNAEVLLICSSNHLQKLTERYNIALHMKDSESFSNKTILACSPVEKKIDIAIQTEMSIQRALSASSLHHEIPALKKGLKKFKNISDMGHENNLKATNDQQGVSRKDKEQEIQSFSSNFPVNQRKYTWGKRSFSGENNIISLDYKEYGKKQNQETRKSINSILSFETEDDPALHRKENRLDEQNEKKDMGNLIHSSNGTPKKQTEHFPMSDYSTYFGNSNLRKELPLIKSQKTERIFPISSSDFDSSSENIFSPKGHNQNEKMPGFQKSNSSVNTCSSWTDFSQCCNESNTSLNNPKMTPTNNELSTNNDSLTNNAQKTPSNLFQNQPPSEIKKVTMPSKSVNTFTSTILRNTFPRKGKSTFKENGKTKNRRVFKF